MPAVGSSSSSSRGLLASARATSSRRWSPYGSLTARLSPLPLRPTKSSSRCASSWAASLLASLGRRPEDRAEPGGVQVVVLADQDVLDRGHGREQADVLVGPRDAVVGDLVRPQLVDRVAVEGDRALVGLVEAGEAVEEGRLAGAVGPDDAGDRALLELEVELADGDQAAEALGDLLGLRAAAHGAPCGRRGGVGRSSPVDRRPTAASGRAPRAPRARGARRLDSVSSSAACSSRRAIRDGRRPSGRTIMMAIRAMP